VERESKKILWSYKGQQKEISTAQPLGGGKYLVAELGPEPRAIVINRKGEILKSTPLACQKKNFHMQTRMLRRLPNGNYIAPHLLDFAVKEYEPDTGKVVHSFPTDDRGRTKRDWPFTAIRLANGNTLVGCTNGNRIIEVDAKGKIVWSVTNADIGENLFDDACGVQRLPNGSAIVDARIAVDEAKKLLNIEFPFNDEYESLGGMIYHQLGRIPRPGESVKLPDAILTIQSASERRVLTIRIDKRPVSEKAS